MFLVIAESPRIPRAARPSLLRPLFNVGRIFWAPEALFQSIRRQPDWVTPFLLAAILSLLLSLAAEPFATRAAWRSLPEGMPTEQIGAMQRQIAFGQKLGAILTPAILLAKTLFAAMILALLTIAWTGRGEYRCAFSVMNHLAVPATLPAAANVLILWMRGLDQIGGLRDLQPRFGLNLLFPGQPRIIDALLGLATPFELWTLVLLTIAVRCITPCPRKTALAIALSYWLLGALVQVGAALL
jgi:hypothetical protein